MPIIKSAIKRAKQTVKRRQHNVTIKNAIKKDVRVVTDAVAAGDAKAANEALRAAISEIDRAVKKGTLHKNTAARKKSRLNKSVVAGLGKEAKPATTKKTASKAVSKPAAKQATSKPAAKKTSVKPAPKK